MEWCEGEGEDLKGRGGGKGSSWHHAQSSAISPWVGLCLTLTQSLQGASSIPSAAAYATVSHAASRADLPFGSVINACSVDTSTGALQGGRRASVARRRPVAGAADSSAMTDDSKRVSASDIRTRGRRRACGDTPVPQR